MIIIIVIIKMVRMRLDTQGTWHRQLRQSIQRHAPYFANGGFNVIAVQEHGGTVREVPTVYISCGRNHQQRRHTHHRSGIWRGARCLIDEWLTRCRNLKSLWPEMPLDAYVKRQQGQMHRISTSNIVTIQTQVRIATIKITIIKWYHVYSLTAKVMWWKNNNDALIKATMVDIDIIDNIE